MLNYQRVYPINIPLNYYKITIYSFQRIASGSQRCHPVPLGVPSFFKIPH